MSTTIDFTPPPTVARFMKSDAFGRIIAGPVGSAKTTGCIFEVLRRCCEQEPGSDGFRYSRWAIVRQTLKQLRDTVLQDITQTWLSAISDYRVSESKIYWRFGDVRAEILLLPLETPEDQRRLLSLQLTGAWISEGIEIPTDLISPLAGRLGRYPSGNLGVATWYGWICDTNMPSEGSDWHRLMTNDIPDLQVFIQPGGMEPDAENLEYLLQSEETKKLSVKIPAELEIRRKQGRKYYERFIEMNSPSWCERYVHARFGPDPSGTAVFGSTFKHNFHVVEDLEPVAAFPLIVGQDFGRDPCSIICQLDHKGRLLILEEVYAEDIGLELHVERNLRPALAKERYMGKSIAIIGDPAGIAKGNVFEENNFDALKRMGFAAFPAPTNDIDRRIRSVEAFLTRQVDGGPAFLIDGKRCPELVRALNGGYRFGFTRSGQRKPKPDKDEYSHIADALQYACLAAHGGMVGYIGNRLGGRMRMRERPKVSVAGWT